MDGTVRVRFDRGVDQLFALLTDPGFLRRRAESVGEKNVVIQVDRDAGKLKIRTDRDLERSLPGFMKKIFNPTNHLTDIQTWDPPGANRSSDWTVEIAGQKRIEMRGRLTLTQVGEGCDYVQAFTVAVAIPLIGGRIEKYILGETETTMRQQIEFLRKEAGATLI